MGVREPLLMKRKAAVVVVVVVVVLASSTGTQAHHSSETRVRHLRQLDRWPWWWVTKSRDMRPRTRVRPQEASQRANVM